MNKFKLYCFIFLVFNTSFAMAQQMGDPQCSSLLLVSSWSNNAVKIYDGCSGEYIRDLDESGNIQGPQKLLELPNGNLLVLSEGNHRLIEYDRNSLSSGEIVMSNSAGGFVTTPISAVVDDDGSLLVSSYAQNRVIRVDMATWTRTDTVLSDGSSLVQGLDNGMALRNGFLYLPAWDSDNIGRLNLSSGALEVFVSSGTRGLDGTRGIIFDGNRMIVASERSNAILVFNADSGDYIEQLVSTNQPAGLVFDGDDHILYTSGNRVYRAGRDGSNPQEVIANGAGTLRGATYVIRLTKLGNDTDQDGLSNDDEEQQHGTDPANPDSDGDGLTDGEEVNQHATDPLSADTDNDQMPDGFEVEYGLAPNQDDADLDLDNDGLTNLAEYQVTTDPTNPDTDGDGKLDGEDGNPLVTDAVPAIAGTPASSVLQDEEYFFAPEVSYTGNMSDLSFSIANQPDWAEFSTETGELNGTPTNNDVGSYTAIEVTVANAIAQVSLAAFDIEVVNVNDAPALSSGNAIPAISLNVDESVSQDLAKYVVDVDINDELTFQASDLETGFELSEQGILTGSSATAGDFNFQLTVTDLAGATLQTSVALRVNEPQSTTPVTPPPANNSSSGGGSFSIYTGISLFLLVVMRRFKRRKH